MNEPKVVQLPSLSRPHLRVKSKICVSPRQHTRYRNLQKKVIQTATSLFPHLVKEPIPEEIIQQLDQSSQLNISRFSETEVLVYPQLEQMSAMKMEIKKSITHLKNLLCNHKRSVRNLNLHIQHLDSILVDQKLLLENQGYFVTFYKNRERSKLDFQQIMIKLYE